jgi:hypothetical protein
MNFQEFVTQRLTAITSQVNSFNQNAKGIDELSPQPFIDIDSRIHVSREGISERINIRQIVEQIENHTFDEIVSVSDPVILFNNLTNVNEVIVSESPTPTWRINNVYYSKNSITKIEVPYATLGLTRIDILIMNTSNDIIIERGIETAGIAVRPPKPNNTIIVSEIYVTDNTVGAPTIPIDLSNKLDKGGYIGTAKILKDDIETKQNYLSWATPQQYGAVGNGIVDDTVAINACMTANLNVLFYGKYKITASINIKDNQMIFSNNSEVIFFTTTLPAFVANEKKGWKIAGKMSILGSGKSNNMASGIKVLGCHEFHIEGVTSKNISGHGFLITEGTNPTPYRGKAGLITGCNSRDNWTGLEYTYGLSVEYNNLTDFNATGNALGLSIKCGNITVIGGNILENDNGIYLGEIPNANNSHGIFSGINVNHSKGYNLKIYRADYGQTIQGCHFYGEVAENIEIINSYGIIFNGCIIDGKISNNDQNEPKGYHLFSQCQMDPYTNVEGEKVHFKNCFTKNGLDFSENDFEWGLLGGKYMYAGAVGHRFAFSDSESTVLYSGGLNGFSINDKTDLVQLLKVTDEGKLNVLGTVTAKPATIGTEMVNLNQLNAVAGSYGSFTPAASLGMIYSLCYWSLIGKLVTITYNFSYTASGGSSVILSHPYPTGITDANVISNSIRGSGTMGVSATNKFGVSLASNNLNSCLLLQTGTLSAGTYKGSGTITFLIP